MIKSIVIAQQVWRETLRRKDLYVLFILLLAFFITLMTLNVFGLKSLVGHIKEIGLLLVWIFCWFLTIGISTRQLPHEEKSGTIFSLLAKPVGRAELIIGKWLGACSMAGLATLVFYVVLGGIVLARGGTFSLRLALEAFLLQCCFIGVLAALGLLLSTRMNGDAAATLTAILSVAAFLILPQVPQWSANVVGRQREIMLAIYYALPHLELFDLRQRLVYDWEPLRIEPLGMILAYGLLVAAMFLVIAWLAYRNKKFSRDII